MMKENSILLYELFPFVQQTTVLYEFGMSEETPNFDIGIMSLIAKEEFSSSGDEVILSIPEPRFQATTEQERNYLLEGADSSSTKRSTKTHVKVFKGNQVIQQMQIKKEIRLKKINEGMWSFAPG